jgi:hypothetical protein
MKKFPSEYYITFLFYFAACLLFAIASNYNIRLIITSVCLSILLTYFYSASVEVGDGKIKVGRDLAFWSEKRTYFFSDILKIRIVNKLEESKLIIYLKNGKRKTRILGCNVCKLAKYLKDYIELEYYSGNTKKEI